jgi:CRP-like cAMP-binding protein
MLSADIIEGFKKAGIDRQYRANEPIFLANEPSTGMYLILQGEAKVIRRIPNGQTIEVAVISAGQTMGEISLLLGQAHSATVIAKTDVQASLLTQRRLEDLRHTDPELTMRLFEILAYTLAGHVINLNRQVDDMRKQMNRLEERVKQEHSTFSYY